MLQTESNVLAALGDETRLGLVTLLSDGAERRITELAAPASISRQAVSKHLKVLEQAGLVAAQRVGRETRYRLKPETLSDAQSYLAALSAQWDRTLSRLQAHVEETSEEG